MNEGDQISELHLNSSTWVNENKLPGFGKLLGSWLNVHRKFCAGTSPEYSWEWAYKERSQIGFLSNAAVLIGGIALEEWGTEKASNGIQGYGRNDLWMHLCPPSTGEDYYIEAKYELIDLRNSVNDSATQIIQIMESANYDARKLTLKDRRLVAISFLKLRFEDENTDMLDNKIRELLIHIQENRQKTNLDAVASISASAEDFQISRKKRKEVSNTWRATEAGLILLASRVVCS